MDVKPDSLPPSTKPNRASSSEPSSTKPNRASSSEPSSTKPNRAPSSEPSSTKPNRASSSEPSSTKPNRALSSEQTIKDTERKPCPCKKTTLPSQMFGPCGRIRDSQQLSWSKPPMNVLVIKKIHDATILPPFVELVYWLIYEKRLSVVTEAAVLSDPLLEKFPDFSKVKGRVTTFSADTDDLTDRVDLVITLGGDGTVLFANTLFKEAAPPLMAFNLGSLGFLTLFDIKNFKGEVSKVLNGQAALTLRARLQCIIHKSGHDKITPLIVLNEVEVDRGSSPYLTSIEIFVNGKFLTLVQGDGVIVSTPTGTTAYAAAAGCSMVHPAVPAMMVTPICPHSLSFRPIVVPAGVELKLALAPGSHSNMWASFDGQHRQELEEGDSIYVTTSPYPLVSVCVEDQFADWFLSIAENLNWNGRKKQKKSEPSNQFSISKTQVKSD